MIGQQLGLPLDVFTDSSSEVLASTKTTKQGSQVAPIWPDARIESPVQASLGIVGVADRPVSRRRRLKPRLDPATEALITDFKEKVLARNSRATAREYAWAFRDTVRLASRLAGRSISIKELFSDAGVLRDMFASPDSSFGDHKMSAWSTAHRRSVVRAFVNLMASQLAALGVSDGDAFVTRELREAAEPIGGGYRLPVGATRGRGGTTPSEFEASAVEAALMGELGWHGLRNGALFAVLRRRGQRIGALLQLDGSNVYLMPDGTFRFLIRAKSSNEPSQLTLPTDVAEILSGYIQAFNKWAKDSGRPERIGAGVAGPFWRGATGAPLTYDSWNALLKHASVRASVTPFTSHAFRRAFATEATEAVPRAVAAIAGSWTSTRRMDDHYTDPSLARVMQQIGAIPTSGKPPETEEQRDPSSIEVEV